MLDFASQRQMDLERLGLSPRNHGLKLIASREESIGVPVSHANNKILPLKVTDARGNAQKLGVKVGKGPMDANQKSSAFAGPDKDGQKSIPINGSDDRKMQTEKPAHSPSSGPRVPAKNLPTLGLNLDISALHKIILAENNALA